MKRLFIATFILALQACTEPSPRKAIETTALNRSPLALDHIDAQSLSSQCDRDMAKTRQDIATLESLPAPYTVDTVLKPLDQLFLSIENGTGMVFLLSNVHPEQDVREAGDRCVQEYSKLITDIGLSEALYQRSKEVNSEDADPLTQRFHEKVLRDFKRSGVDKDTQSREKIRALNEDIIKLGQDFSRNTREDVRHILVTETQLAGMPEDFIQQHPLDEEGLATITTDYPDVYPFLQYAHDDNKRLAIYKEFLNRGYPDNKQVLTDIITKRYELAQRLGYVDYAAFVTEELMVKSPAVVDNFIQRINQLVDKRSKADYAQLLATLQVQSPQASEVGNWQKSYLEEIVRKQQYQVDTKVIRQYFQYDNVTDGIFQLVSDLFDVQIKPWDTPVWHKSVKAYEMWENGEVIGQFYLDMHPRPGKYGHAAQFGIRPGVLGQQLPVAALVCNFPGESDGSELMEHRQVETFLHEFGHLIHSIFGGRQQWATFSGVATERDFVEAPSQMLEEWIWDYDTLKRFARNSEGEVIPVALVEKMHAARLFARGTHIRNQMFYAALSLKYYQTPPEQLDLDKILIDTQEAYSPFGYIENTHFYSSFGHLYGYSAAYYTYMWSEVIAADILAEFEKKGMRNTEVARHYRQSILAAGGTKDASELVEDFLGRPTNFDAFIQRLKGVK